MNQDQDLQLQQLNHAMAQRVDHLRDLIYPQSNEEVFKEMRAWEAVDMAREYDPAEEARLRALPKASTRLKNRLKRKRKK